MPHISKREIDQKTFVDLENYLYSVVANHNTKERKLVFNELLTPTEKIMLAKRLGIILMLERGDSIYKIMKTLGISPSTAKRFELKHDLGKYTHCANWLYKQTKQGKTDELMKSLISLAFTGRKQSFKKFVENY